MFVWLLSCLVTIFTNWSSLYLVLRYSAVLIIGALYAASICNKPFALLLCLHMAYLYRSLRDAFYTLLFSCRSSTSPNLQLMNPKLYLNTGRANALIVVALLLTFNFISSPFLNLLVYSFFRLPVTYWCYVPPLFSVLRYCYVYYCIDFKY